LTSSVGSDTSAVEDAVTAELTHAVTMDGRDVLPAGATLSGVVTVVDGSGRLRGRAMIGFRFRFHRQERRNTGSKPQAYHLRPPLSRNRKCASALAPTSRPTSPCR
jgi:hypothetical protein